MALQRKLNPFFGIVFHRPKVQHPIERSRTKNFLTKVIRAVAKVYLCENDFGSWWHLKWSIQIATLVTGRLSEKPKRKKKIPTIAVVAVISNFDT